VGAGTIEFLLDSDQKYYFMEMNTRLQVEHPVSEFITNLDFVAWQLDIAEGLPLPLQQDELSEQGHSIEVRLYAEDPQKDFLPSTGQLKQLQFPEKNTGLRIDTGVKQSDEITAFYDPLLAKIISHGGNREQAIQKLLFALQQTKISGISSNLDYLKALLRSEAFHQGLLSTHFLEKHPLDFTASETERNSAFFIAALAFYLTENRTTNNDPWKKNIGWRLNQASCYPITLRHFSSEEAIDKNLRVKQLGENNFSVEDEKGPLPIESFSSACEDQFQFSISDQAPILVSVFRQKDTLTLHFTNYSLSFSQQKLSSNNFQKNQSSGSKFNHAPMSGRIVEIFCSSEQILTTGSPILAMEAMKMEHIIKAPEAGQVTQFHVQPESFIEEGSLLFDFQKDT
jgi:3-methylcrotonyl-CoA carboxylase alpha subunit